MKPGIEPLGHHGWTGVSDLMPRAVFANGCGTSEALKVLRWHQHQAHHRALQAWAEDPRRDAWMPSTGEITYSPAKFDADQDVRAHVHLKPFMLHPDWDVPEHPPTWLVECVDGPVSGAMHTIPWPDGEDLPPAMIEKSNPGTSGPRILAYYLRDTDSINGIARYTAVQRPGLDDENTAPHMIREARIYFAGGDAR